MNLEITIEQQALALDPARFEREVATVAERAGYTGELSVAVVTNERIHDLNRRYLEHDYVTDVLAFPLSEGDEEIEGEVVVSAERAIEEAAIRGVDPHAELMLYVVHGILHLLGHDDHDPVAARRMHAETLRLLRGLGYRNRISPAEPEDR